MNGEFCGRCGREFEDGEAVIKTQLAVWHSKSDDMWSIEEVRGREPVYWCLGCLAK